MSNPLLSASEQAHLDTVRSMPHSPDEHTPTPQPTNAMEAVTGFLARVDWSQMYDAGTLAIIGVCAIAHVITASGSTSPFTAILPVFGLVACLAYALVCFASPRRSPIKLFFVTGALTTFWIQ